MYCDVTPWRLRHKGIGPTERGNARGGPPGIGSDLPPYIFNYCFLCSIVVYGRFASPRGHRGGGMVGALVLYYAGSRDIIEGRSTRRLREWRA